MKIDISLDACLIPGFVRIAPAAAPGVDIVSDLKSALPLPDHSAEFVMASRTLAYADELNTLLQEIYRICAHKAVVCVLAPYAHSFCHISNPELKHKFDEYTPRYWTPRFSQPPYGPRCPDIPGYPPAAPPFDFRLLRMELFYRHPYRMPWFEDEELEVLKTLQANVVHEIMYHFAVVKQPVETRELEELSRGVYPEPPGLR